MKYLEICDIVIPSKKQQEDESSLPSIKNDTLRHDCASAFLLPFGREE
jgi:hypothetical protein